MKAGIQHKHRDVLLVCLFILTCTFRLAAQVPSSPVPATLKVPDGQVLLLKALGKGVQIYECKARPANQFPWVLKAPEVDLINDQGEKIGRHYGGPTWEASGGSKVVGEVRQRADAVSPDAIPWLLLKAKSNEGTDMFGTVTYIQRLDTEGGRPPEKGCDSEHMGAEARVDYKAEYYFYAAAH